MPSRFLLLGAVAQLQFEQLSQEKARIASRVPGGGALGSHRAGLALVLGEAGHDPLWLTWTDPSKPEWITLVHGRHLGNAL
jgi:hypothetical protein